MNTQLEKVLLGSLILAPSLLESCNIQASDFPSGRTRQAFEAIANLWEDGRPREIDPVILSQKLDGDGAGAFVGELMSDMIRVEPEVFTGRLAEMRRQRLSERIVTIAANLGQVHLKTGNLDPKEVANLKQLIAEQSELTTGKKIEAPLMTSLAGVEPQPVEWLWPNFIPFGKATMISGDPNVGKTWLALDIAARLSRGLPWPDGSAAPEASNILYLSVEDNPADTLRPRIDSLGGDPSKIAILNPDCPDFVTFAEEDGVKRLEDEILRVGNVRLIVLDPVLDFSGGINPNAAEQVRAFLTPLIRIAEKLNLALVLVAHLNKAQSQSAIYRTGGSTSAWLGKCRAAFMVFRDNDDKKKRYISAIKSNLAQQDPPQLSFIPDAGRLLFETVTEEVNVDEQLNPQLRGQGGEKEEESFAMSWLRDALESGPVDNKEVKRDARECGISERTLKRAGQRMNLNMKSEGFGRFRTTIWSLREETKQ